MRALRFILLWLATVTIFALYGWFSHEPYSGYTHHGPFYSDLRFETGVGFAAIGVGAASYVVTGLILVGGVRSHRLSRGWAALLLLASGGAAMILPWLIVSVIMRATQDSAGDYGAEIHLFQGEHGWWLLLAPFYTFWIVLCALIVFLVCVFRLRFQK